MIVRIMQNCMSSLKHSSTVYLVIRVKFINTELCRSNHALPLAEICCLISGLLQKLGVSLLAVKEIE